MSNPSLEPLRDTSNILTLYRIKYIYYSNIYDRRENRQKELPEQEVKRDVYQYYKKIAAKSRALNISTIQKRFSTEAKILRN